MTLIDVVCSDCNSRFGRSLDFFLTRDSIEAFLRYGAGLKDPMDLTGMFTNRMDVTIPQDGSIIAGARLRIVPSADVEGLPHVELLAQVGFERADSRGWDYWTDTELSSTENFVSIYRSRYAGRCIILFESAEEKERIRALLIDIGVKFEDGEEAAFQLIDPSLEKQVTIQFRASFDRELARSVAKIGFNYLAYVHGSHFILRRDFDAVREFIFEGMGDWREFVQLSSQAILADDLADYRQTRGHVIVLGWRARLSEIYCKLSPYNMTTYVIRLCNEFEGIWREVASGHIFDVSALKVRRLFLTRLIGPPSLRLPF